MPFFTPPWNDLIDPVSDGVWLTGFNSKATAFLSAESIRYLPSTVFSSLPSVVRCLGLGSSD